MSGHVLRGFDDHAAAERIAPQNLEAEKAVLGAILIAPDGYGRAIELLRPEDFYRDAHARIFRAMSRVARQERAIDPLTLAEELSRSQELEQAGSAGYLASLTDGVPTTLNLEHYAGIVRARSREREALRQLRRAAVAVEQGDLTGASVVVDAFRESAADTDEPLLEPLSAVAARTTAEPPRMLIAGLLPAAGITLTFGQPRTMKSLIARAIAVAVASGQAPFGMARLSVSDAAPVVYLTEEDSAQAVFEHLNCFSGGTADRLPIYLSACRGITLDEPRTQAQVIRECRFVGAGLIVIEPARSVTACVDQGPRELQPFAQFLRRLTRETGASVLLGHHEVKQQAGHDGRKGAQRVSGGGLFSICESPIVFERLDERRVLLSPTSWKHFADPPALAIRLDLAGGRVRELVAEEHAAAEAEAQAIRTVRDRVLLVVTETPGLSSTLVAVTVGGNKAAVLKALTDLARGGQIRSERQGQVARWFPTSGGVL